VFGTYPPCSFHTVLKSRNHPQSHAAQSVCIHTFNLQWCVFQTTIVITNALSRLFSKFFIRYFRYLSHAFIYTQYALEIEGTRVNKSPRTDLLDAVRQYLIHNHAGMRTTSATVGRNEPTSFRRGFMARPRRLPHAFNAPHWRRQALHTIGIRMIYSTWTII